MRVAMNLGRCGNYTSVPLPFGTMDRRSSLSSEPRQLMKACPPALAQIEHHRRLSPVVEPASLGTNHTVIRKGTRIIFRAAPPRCAFLHLYRTTFLKSNHQGYNRRMCLF